jgi:tellurite resistance protein
VEKILQKYQMDTCNVMWTPVEVRGDREQYGEREEGEAALDGSLPYFTVIGELMWLANRTRPDIAFAVNVLARHTSNPCMRHWRGAQRIMKYLKGTVDYGIFYKKNNPGATLMGYADAGYKSDKKTARSQGGYVFTHGDAAISWKSKKQTVVATSTAHSELIALYEGVREASWLHRVMMFVETSTGLTKKVMPIRIYEDNEACIAQVRKGFMKTDATKHIDPKYQAWISQENGNVVDVQPINSERNTADVFTKALPKAVHWKHMNGLGMMSKVEAAILRS